jgi:hypothetical protein
LGHHGEHKVGGKDEREGVAKGGRQR